jgi:hypothetical protein
MARRSPSIRTFGLTHVALAVRDPAPDFSQAQTPGTHDVLALERSARSIGRSGGIAHFGFRLTDPLDLDAAVAAVRAAGGTVTEQGSFVPGEPYAFVRDLDGYLLEIWYELPTPVDPAPAPGARRPASGRRPGGRGHDGGTAAKPPDEV